jgi:(p)ppGpp synthase/HD superfamily hydrolase
VEFATAVGIAAHAYAARRDSSGRLLLAEAVNVAQALGSGATEAALISAVLYGVPQNTTWTVDDLARMGVDSVVCEVVDLLKHRRGESYMDFVRRVCAAPGLSGETARLVMVADLRIGIARTDSDALRERYESSLPLVRSALATAS